MAAYTTRVKLENATREDYEQLSGLLREKAFKLETSGHNTVQGTEAALHDRSFIKQGSIENVVQGVLSAARKTGRQFSFTVIKEKN